MTDDQAIYFAAGALVGVFVDFVGGIAIRAFSRWDTRRFIRKTEREYQRQLYYRPRAYPRDVQ